MMSVARLRFRVKMGPAGQARYARCGHFVTCVPLRLALPLVAMKDLSADQREAQGEAGIHVTK
jgi:hypothetical protein